MTILRVFIVRNDGKTIYGKCYEKDRTVASPAIPAHIRACLVLLSSSRSTQRGVPYVLEQDDILWVYCFFESFAVVVEATKDGPVEWLKRTVYSVGKDILRNFSGVISAWPGDISDVEGISDVIDGYARFGMRPLDESTVHGIESLIDDVLSRYEIAYAGVFGPLGEMIAGNVPHRHTEIISEEILRGAIRPSVDLVPTSVDIDGYRVRLLQARALTAVAAPYRHGSDIKAVQAVSELATEIERLLATD
ncbi:MAG: hypothetical protein ACTSPE_12680 [Candidatus Thorarchaeota archaeon]